MTPLKQANKSFVFIHPDGRREKRSYCYSKPVRIHKKRPVLDHQQTMRSIARLGLNASDFRKANPHLSDFDLFARARKIARERHQFNRVLAKPVGVRFPTDASVEHSVTKNTSKSSNDPQIDREVKRLDHPSVDSQATTVSGALKTPGSPDSIGLYC